MIRYFSGTGNTRAVAERLATLLGESAAPMPGAQDLYKRETPDAPAPKDCDAGTSPGGSGGKGEALGLCFPVYAWGPPRAVLQWITAQGGAGKLQQYTYIYMVCTCGDDCGRTTRLMRRALARYHATLQAAWSVAMPNTYIALPGFCIDPDAVARQKVLATSERLAGIAHAIRARHAGIDATVPGALPWIKTYVLRPLFNRFLAREGRFRLEASRCTHCHRCEHACPAANIRLEDSELPAWQHHCADCLACVHACPTRAIDLGRFTRGKARYAAKRYTDLL